VPLCSVDVVMTSSKMPFITVSEVKKADNILDNKF